jgi:hypothetical protein
VPRLLQHVRREATLPHAWQPSWRARCCKLASPAHPVPRTRLSRPALRSTTVFSHAQTVVICSGCSTVLCQPTGGKARLTEGCSFRKKVE